MRTGDDLPSGYRLGLSTLEIDDSSRDNLVRYCYVVHPWERLRKSRLEVEARTPILIGASSEVTDDDSGLAGRRQGSDQRQPKKASNAREAKLYNSTSQRA
jgi:hypothetical protein